MKVVPLCVLILFSFPLKASFDIPWEPDSDPGIMSNFYNKKFRELPLKGKVFESRKYWSGDYWALNKGNINYRWYAKKKIGFNLPSPNYEEARRLSIPQLAELSPSEKYDLFIGRYDYPLKNQVAQIANPKAETWEGICHGWSPASMNHNEPRPKLMRNPDGLEIPFGSTDIKALISYYYAHVHQAPDTHQMGKRCFRGGFLNRDKDCWDDMNAGAFHIVLANRIGLDGQGFVADLNRFEQVWNHPIIAYESKIVRESSNSVELKVTLTYVDENGNDWHPVIGTKKQHTEKLTYHYKLDLDAYGEITGGDWISKDRPDFLWIMRKPREFVGIFSKLPELLDD